MNKNELPKSVTYDVCDLGYEIEPELSEMIANQLSDDYGYCINNYNYSVKVVVNNIDWDTTD